MGGVAGPPRWGRGGARRKIVGPGWNATAGLGVVRAPHRSAPTKGDVGVYRGMIGTIRHRLTPYRARPSRRGEASPTDASVKVGKKRTPLIFEAEGDCKSYEREIERKDTRPEGLLLLGRSRLERFKRPILPIDRVPCSPTRVPKRLGHACQADLVEIRRFADIKFFSTAVRPTGAVPLSQNSSNIAAISPRNHALRQICPRCGIMSSTIHNGLRPNFPCATCRYIWPNLSQ